MRPTLFVFTALILELCLARLCLAAGNTDDLYRACLVKHSDENIVFGCTQLHTSDMASSNECISAQQKNQYGGSISRTCEEIVHASCAKVNFCPDLIAGCEKYGSPACSDAAISDGAAPRTMYQSEVPGTGAATTPPVATGPAGSPNPTRAAAPASARPADAEVSADLQACQTALSQASQCCKNPSSCSTSSTTSAAPAPDPGLSAACQQMQKASYENARANNAAASNCSARSSSCNGACSALVTKYSGIASLSATYQNALEQGQNAQRTCGGFGAIVQRLGEQARNSADTSGSGFQCGQNTAINSASLLGALQSGESSDLPPSTSSMYDCVNNPMSPSCLGAQAQPTPTPEGPASEAAFRESGSKDKPEFDVGPSEGINAGSVLPVAAGSPSTPGAANVVANNSGGAIPGGGGTSPASLGAGASGKGKASPGSPGYTTDVMQGDRSGGYSQGYQPPVLDDGLSGGPGGRHGTGRPVGRGLASVGGGVDLKQYLPGGSLDPNRHLGGLAGGRHILGRFDDMWKNVSNRYQEKCKLGLLLDCR